MKRVIVESPYAGHTSRNLAYLKRAMLDCLARGESPYASHALLTPILDDNDPDQRKAGIAAGLEWASVADHIVYYLDLGMSSGMLYALERHVQAARTIEVRLLCGAPALGFNYTNWKGENGFRKAVYKSFYWGRTDYHPKDQVLMRAHCLDRNEERIFAVADMKFPVVENVVGLL